MNTESAASREHLIALSQTVRESLQRKNASNLVIEVHRKQLPPIEALFIHQPAFPGLKQVADPVVFMQVKPAQRFNRAAKRSTPALVGIRSRQPQINHPIPSLLRPWAAQWIVL